MAYFHMKLLGPRPAFPFDATDTEKAAMAEHVAYWRAKTEAGTAIVVGPVFDPAGAYGMAVVEVEEQPDAQALADNDPVIKAGLGFAYAIASIPSIMLRT